MIKLLCSLCAICATVSSPVKPVIPAAMTLKGGSEHVESVAFSRDGRIVASGGWDDSVSLWDVETGKKIAVLKGHLGSVSALSFAPDGKTLVSASYDGTVKLWDIATRKNTHTLKAHSKILYALAISPDGKTIAAAGYERYIDLWNTETLENAATYDDTFVTSLAFSPDGKRLASGNDEAEIRIWESATGKLVHRWKRRQERHGMVRSLGFSPDGRELACEAGDVGDEKLADFWNYDTGALVGTLGLPLPAVYSMSVAFSPNGEMLAVATISDKEEECAPNCLHPTWGTRKRAGEVPGGAWCLERFS